MQRTNLPEHAVDAVANAKKAGFGFEMDVGRFALYGVGQDGVDQPDDRLAILVGRGLKTAKVDLAGFNFVQNAVNRQLVAIGLVDRPGNLGFAGEQGFDLNGVTGQSPDLVKRDNVVDIGLGDRQAVMFGVVIEGQHVVPFGKLVRYQGQRGRVDDCAGEVDTLLAKAFGERVAQGRFRYEAQRNEQLADRLIRFQLFEQGDAKLILAEDALGDQYLAEWPVVWD